MADGSAEGNTFGQKLNFVTASWHAGGVAAAISEEVPDGPFLLKNSKFIWLQNDSCLQHCSAVAAFEQPLLEKPLAVSSCQLWQTFWLQTESLF